MQDAASLSLSLTPNSDEQAIRLTSRTDDEVSTSSTAPTVPKRKRWLSIVVLYLTLIDASSAFSAMTTSLFPYLLHLTDGKAPTTLLGLIIAGYSVGSVLMAPILGFWSDRRPIKEPLIACLSASFVANIAYSYASALPNGGQYLVLVSRIVIGGCSAISAIVKSYIAYATTETERSIGMAGSSGSQTVGVLLGPLLALMFVPLGSQGIYIPAIRFHFNMYTGPTYVSALLDIINIILVAAAFRDYRISSTKREKFCTKSDKKGVDWLVLIVILMISFLTYITFSVYSSILVPYSMDEFAWSKQQAIFYNGVIFSLLALLATSSYIVVGIITKRVELRIVIITGFFILGISLLILMPMSDQYPKIMSVVQSNSTAAVTVGCRINQLKWCQQIPQLLLPQYIVGLIVMTVGYASTILPTLTLYSRVLGPYPQGVLMGASSSVNSLGLAIGPPIVTLMYDRTGPQITLATVVGVVVVAIIIVMVFCYRMVPYGQKHSLAVN